MPNVDDIFVCEAACKLNRKVKKSNTNINKEKKSTCLCEVKNFLNKIKVTLENEHDMQISNLKKLIIFCMLLDTFHDSVNANSTPSTGTRMNEPYANANANSHDRFQDRC